MSLVDLCSTGQTLDHIQYIGPSCPLPDVLDYPNLITFPIARATCLPGIGCLSAFWPMVENAHCYGPENRVVTTHCATDALYIVGLLFVVISCVLFYKTRYAVWSQFFWLGLIDLFVPALVKTTNLDDSPGWLLLRLLARSYSGRWFLILFVASSIKGLRPWFSTMQKRDGRRVSRKDETNFAADVVDFGMQRCTYASDIVTTSWGLGLFAFVLRVIIK